MNDYQFLEAQLLCDQIDVTDSSLTFDDISVVVDLFGRSLRFNHQDFDKEAISDGCRSEIPGIVEGFSTLSDFRDLSFCGSW